MKFLRVLAGLVWGLGLLLIIAAFAGSDGIQYEAGQAGAVLFAGGYALYYFLGWRIDNAPLHVSNMPKPPAPQSMPAPPPAEVPAKPAKPPEPPTYGTQGYRWRVAIFFVHSLVYFILSGFKGFVFAMALVAVWLLPQLPAEHMKEGLFAFFFVALASAGLAVVPWFVIRWFLWPISEPEWPGRPAPAPQPEIPANPAPTAPIAAPAPPPLQRPAETMVSATPSAPTTPGKQNPKNPDLERWTSRS